MSIVLGLPTDIIHSIYLEWIVLPDFCSFDTAVCSSSYRRQFLSSIDPSHVNLIFKGSECVLTSEMLQYLQTRNLALVSLELNNLALMESWQGNVPSSFARMLELTFKSCNNSSTVALSEFCAVTSRLSRLTLTNTAFVSSSTVLSAVQRSGATLRSVSLCGCLVIRNTALFELARYCTMLEELCLDNCPKLTDEGFVQVAEHSDCGAMFSSLNTVHLSDNRQLECQTILQFLLRCEQLTDVAAGGCYGLTDSFVAELLEGVAGDGLRSLNINSTDITDASLHSVGQKCPGLTALNISDCADVTDAGLAHISRNCGLLTELRCSSCMELSDTSLASLVQVCPSLTLLDASRCLDVGNETVAALAAHCSGLTSLAMSSNDELRDPALAKLAVACASLTSVDVSYCVFQTDDSLLPLVRNNPLLRAFVAVECELLTDEVLVSLGYHCHQLRELNLNLCFSVTDAGLLALVGSCPLLELLLVSQTQVSSVSLVPLVRASPRLSFVDLSGVEGNLDEVLAALGSRCRGLLKLNLAKCLVSSASFVQFTQAAKSLIELDISSCPLLGEEALSSLAAGGCPLLELLYCGSRRGEHRLQSVEALSQARLSLVVIDAGGGQDDADFEDEDEDLDFDGEDESIDDLQMDSELDGEEGEEEELADEDMVIILQPLDDDEDEEEDDA